MKTRISFIVFILAVFSLISCSDFLDEMPDKRAELNDEKKIKDLLVSGYSIVDPMMIYEHRTDNVVDNGRQYGQPTSTMIQENYYWQDISEVDWDAPEKFWTEAYKAIAVANQALDALAKVGETPSNAHIRGEALLCRAYHHFILANTFCQPYAESTAESDLGIPYVLKPETTIGTMYDRGTMKSVYENIEKDLEEGFPLIDDHSYQVPLYHFTKKAAAAFAARFYLFYGKYELAVEYANMVRPEENLRNYFNKYTSANTAVEWRNLYMSHNEPANILNIALRSMWGRYYGTLRFGPSEALAGSVSYRSNGPWGGMLDAYDGLWGASGMPVKTLPKYAEMFEMTDISAQTGQPHVVYPTFTTDETLLCRAEAKVMLKQYEAAAEDLRSYYKSKSESDRHAGYAALTADSIVNYYVEKQKSDDASLAGESLSPWFVLVKPFNAKFNIEDGMQEKMLQAVLHVRRIETMHSGLRWLDIRRYGIEVIHNRDQESHITLPPDDLRRVIQIPKAVIAAGLQPNPSK